MVSELLEGETLRSWLAGGTLTPRKALGHALQIAHGLAAVHEKGIVHRDLKPENIFVTKDGRIKILEFGLAKLTQAETVSGPQSALPTKSGGTQPGVVLGTLGYMSPEQVRGKPADARSDIFSFGAILYEMLSGKRAFRGGSVAETMMAILHEEPNPALLPRSPTAGFGRILQHCLEKRPEDRYRCAEDLAFELSRFVAPAEVADLVRPSDRTSRGRVASRATVAAVVAIGLFAAGHWIGGRRGARPIRAAVGVASAMVEAACRPPFSARPSEGEATPHPVFRLRGCTVE